MKINAHAIYWTLISLLITATAQIYYDYYYIPQISREVGVYYNQDTAVNKKIVQVIEEADAFVYFAIYTFTRDDIKDALIAAKKRGLDVRGIIDREQTSKIDSQKAIVNEIIASGIAISFNDHSAIMHIKSLVTEKAFVSGSYNWTAAATNVNDEVVEIGRDPNLRSQYEKLLRTLLNKYPA